MAKKTNPALTRLAAMGAALPESKTTAAGVTTRKGPGGRPKRYAAGYSRLSIYLTPEDKGEVERFTLWLSAREGKRLSMADALIAAMKDSKLFRAFSEGR